LQFDSKWKDWWIGRNISNLQDYAVVFAVPTMRRERDLEFPNGGLVVRALVFAAINVSQVGGDADKTDFG